MCLRELHSFPILIARIVLRAELDSPGLIGGAFRVRDVGLEFYGICTGLRDCIDIGVGKAQASVVCLCDLSNDDASRSVRINMVVGQSAAKCFVIVMRMDK